MTDPYPVLTELKQNGEVICTGDIGPIRPNEQVSQIELFHELIINAQHPVPVVTRPLPTQRPYTQTGPNSPLRQPLAQTGPNSLPDRSPVAQTEPYSPLVQPGPTFLNAAQSNVQTEPACMQESDVGYIAYQQPSYRDFSLEEPARSIPKQLPSQIARQPSSGTSLNEPKRVEQRTFIGSPEIRKINLSNQEFQETNNNRPSNPDDLVETRIQQELVIISPARRIPVILQNLLDTGRVWPGHTVQTESYIQPLSEKLLPPELNDPAIFRE